MEDASSPSFRKLWNAMVFLFKEGGALDTSTPPRKHSRSQVEQDAFKLTSTALTALQKHVDKNTHILEDL